MRQFIVIFLISFCGFVSNSYGLGLPDFTKLVEQQSAAVVNISTSTKKSSAGGMPPMFNLPDIPEGSPFYEFFKKYFEQMPQQQENPFQERLSLGSGFIVSEDGYVITNHHVVKDADEIIVRLNDRREFVAALIGSDERSDIAVLKLDAVALPTLQFGDSTKLKVGEWVLAIGSPFGLDHSVTAGIISAIGRNLPSDNYVPFIQTDVAINPGNSGGPLFNLEGQVIGVNSQIYSRTGGFMGLSFAVPVDVVQNVYQQLRDRGHVTRGWLGVLIQDVTRELAESFGMNHPHGALIAKVLSDGPAAAAGIEVGDIIVKFNKKKIIFSSDLPPLVGRTIVGTKVPVEIIRRAKHQTIDIDIAKLPNETVIAKNNSSDKSSGSDNALKITVKDLSKEQEKELELNNQGILVETVKPGPAQAAGVRTGDILLLIDNIKIKNVAHFNKLLKDIPTGRSVPVLIQRRGGPIFLAIKIKE